MYTPAYLAKYGYVAHCYSYVHFVDGADWPSQMTLLNPLYESFKFQEAIQMFLIISYMVSNFIKIKAFIIGTVCPDEVMGVRKKF